MGKQEIIVSVGLKNGISDPEGNNIKKALKLLGFDEIEEVKVVKNYKMIMEIGAKEDAEARIKEMAEKLLTNPVIHDYKIIW